MGSCYIPGVQDFDHLVPGLSLPLCVQSKALEEPLRMHKHHFVELVFLSVIGEDKWKTKIQLQKSQTKHN